MPLFYCNKSVLLLILLTINQVTPYPKRFKKVDESCPDLVCVEPSSSEKTSQGCQIVSKDSPEKQKDDDFSLPPLPSGPSADCCPLWKCYKDGGNKDGDFYTIHGKR